MTLPTRVIAARDSSGCTDQAIIDFHAANGPPYIFGSMNRRQVGELIRLGDQVFKIVRMATREEWMRYTKPVRLPVPMPVCYFEAVTD